MIAATFNHESGEQPPNDDDSAEPPDTEIQSALDQLINDKKYGRPSPLLLCLLRALSSDKEHDKYAQEDPGRDLMLIPHYRYENRGWRNNLLRKGIILTGENGQDALTRLGRACLAALETQSIIDSAQAQASKKRKPHITLARTLSAPEISS